MINYVVRLSYQEDESGDDFPQFGLRLPPIKVAFPAH
jgi:hypothetical protein